MSLQLSVALRNALLDALESMVGTSPKLQLRTGSPPANCAASDSGSLLAELTLPADWMAGASSGVKSILGGPWTGTASGAGTAGHFRLKDSGGTTCHQQGTVGQGSGDLSMDNPVLANGQNVSITGWTLTAGNA